MMNYDIASELEGLFDLSRNIPSLTTFLIAASGILVLGAAITLILLTMKNVGLHVFPLIYGLSAYVIFYMFGGGIIASGIASMVSSIDNTANLAVAQLFAILASSACLVLGRFAAMWFIKRYYSSYGDCYGIGLGVSLTEGAITAITIFFNYCLCLTINNTGLAELANSYSSAAEASEQLSTIMVFFDTPSIYYLISGTETVMVMIFHTMISVLFYAVYHGNMKRYHIGTIIGLYTLMSLPISFYGIDFMFNRMTCFIAEIIIFAASILFFLRVHNTYYKDIEVVQPARKIGRSSVQPAKMPKFNDKINKL